MKWMVSWLEYYIKEKEGEKWMHAYISISVYKTIYMDRGVDFERTMK